MSIFDNMSPEAMAAYARLKARFPDLDLDSRVRSAYRSPAHNKKVGGAKHSQHMKGNALDFSVHDLPRETQIELIRAAREVGMPGVGVYDGRSLHFDVGPARAWGADYTRATLPDWAKGALTGNPFNPPKKQGILSNLMQDAGELVAEKDDDETNDKIKKYALLSQLVPEDQSLDMQAPAPLDSGPIQFKRNDNPINLQILQFLAGLT